MMQNERLRTKATTAEAAEETAVTALAFLAKDPNELQRFLQLSGLEPHLLRQAAREPGFFLGVLDYLLGDERSLAAFEAGSGVSAQNVLAARSALAPDPGEFS